MTPTVSEFFTQVRHPPISYGRVVGTLCVAPCPVVSPLSRGSEPFERHDTKEHKGLRPLHLVGPSKMLVAPLSCVILCPSQLKGAVIGAPIIGRNLLFTLSLK